MGERPTLPLAMHALDMALLARLPHEGLVHHTDQGPLYRAHAYRERLTARGVNPSMSAKGNAYDNAVAESFFSTLKNELVHHCDVVTRCSLKSNGSPSGGGPARRLKKESRN